MFSNCVERFPVLVIIFLLVFPHSLGGFLDLDELNNIQYSIQIFDTPVGIVEQNDGAVAAGTTNVVTMVNKQGQKYRCQLPKQESDIDSNGENTTSEDPVDVNSLLSPLNTGPCLLRTKDWWTYEVCVGRKITQYHMENDRPVGAIIYLGSHNPEREDHRANLTYHPQWYTNGSRCDLTGSSRQTELRFVCSESAVTEFIGDIFEPQSCEYTIVIYTDKVCSIPHLRPPKEPSPLEIGCHPILSEAQLEEYEQFALLKAKKAEIKLRKLKEKQKKIENLLSGKGDVFSLFGSGVADRLMGELGSMLGGPQTGSVKIVNFDFDGQANALGGPQSGGLGEAGTLPGGEGAAGTLSGGEGVAGTLPGGEGVAGALTGGEDEPVPHSDPTQPVGSESGTSGTSSSGNSGGSSSSGSGSGSGSSGGSSGSSSSGGSDSLGWNLIHKEKPSGSPSAELEKLKEEQNSIWKRIHENKKLIKKFTGQLHDTQTFIKDNLEKEPRYDAGIMEKLEMQEQQLEMVIEKTKETVLQLETQFKDMNLKILKKMKQLNTSKEKKLGGEGGDDNEEEEEIDNLDEELELLQKEFREKVDRLGLDQREKLDKMKDIMKEDMMDQLSAIMKEAATELNMDQTDIQEGETMEAVTEELTGLLSRLGGAEKGVEAVQKQLDHIRGKMNSGESLKRDGKKSVKKELREDDPSEKEGELEELEDDRDGMKTDVLLKESKEQLETIESELDLVEKELRENKEKLGSDQEKMVKLSKIISGNQLEPIQDAQNNKLVQKLETTIQQKLEKMGIDTGGRPIEIKVITTQIPVGGDDLDVEEGGAHFESMVFNLLSGNQQGYQDIDSQWKTEKNYKFSWDKSMMETITSELEALEAEDGERDGVEPTEGGEAGLQGLNSLFQAQNEGEEVEVVEFGVDENEIAANTEFSGENFLYHGGDERTRPSSRVNRRQVNEEEEEEEEEDDQELDMEEPSLGMLERLARELDTIAMTDFDYELGAEEEDYPLEEEGDEEGEEGNNVRGREEL